MASIVVNGDTSGAVTLSAPATAGTVTVTLPSANGTMLTTASSTGISGSAISSGTVAEAYGGTGTSTGYYGFKNRIINGAMVIDQRNAGASVTLNGSESFITDRFSCGDVTDGSFTAQQVSDAPAGFINSLKCTITSADTSLTTTQTAYCFQTVEGLNIADLAWGTANAATITISFWVKSSLTGTFGGALRNSAANRAYPFTYAISAANTWEYETITIAGDTSGTWLTTNGVGINLQFSLGAGPDRLGTAGAWNANNNVGATGQVQIIGTNGATWQVTGVQLEKGSTATSFDYRPIGTELALCQRYCYMFQNPTGASGDGSLIGSGYADTSSQGVYFITFPVSMRTTPSLTTVSTANGIEQAYYNGTVTTHNPTSISLISNITTPNGGLMTVGGASFSNGTGAFLRYATQSITPCVFVSAEL